MKTFSIDCLKAIAHLSQNMQNRIIADVTRFMLTGEIPEKLPAMRRALMISLILMLDPSADISAFTCGSTTSVDSVESGSIDNTADTPAHHPHSPNYIALSPSGTPVPLCSPSTSIPPVARTRAEKRRLLRAVM